MKTQTLIAAAGLLALSFSAGSAHAGTLACSADIAGLVSGTDGCEVSDTAGQDFLNTTPMTVNAEAFFDTTDWIFGGKIGEAAGYLGDGEGQSGTWDISNVVQSTWDDIMLVFKSGNGTFLTSYSIADGVDSGTWSSPFPQFKPNGDPKSPKDVSHISVYYTSGGEVSTPEPGVAVALGMMALGAAKARKRR